MSDHNKPQNDIAKPDEQAHELIDQLNLLEAVDRHITPQHVARRFRELLDDMPSSAAIGDSTTAHRSDSARARSAKAIGWTGAAGETSGGGTLVAEAGPVVRPYALTQGRTRHTGESFDLVATVMATQAAITDPGSLAPEHMSVLQLARAPTTVADIASDVDLPLGVVRIILADLRELGLIMIRTPVVMAERIDKHTLREVLNGLRGL